MLKAGGWDSGWTAYPPLSLRGAVGYQFMFLAVFAIGLSSILGSLNLIATIFLMRPKGMSLFRMPIFCWAVLATSLIQLTATQFIDLGLPAHRRSVSCVEILQGICPD